MAAMVELTCEVCSKAFETRKILTKDRSVRFCSRACFYARIAIEKQERTLHLKCGTCGAPVDKSPSQFAIAKHGAVFCSRECHYKGRSIGVTKRVVTKPYTYTPEGKAAMRASSNKPRGQRAFHPTICVNCSIEFDDPNDGRDRTSGLHFCSLKCCNDYRKGDKNPAWRGGHPTYYGPDWRRIRRAARVRDSHKCRRCAVPSLPGKYHDVHHIKPVSTFENVNDANTMDNVVTLCHSCHMLVEWRGIDFDMSAAP
jgi:hypothetical protein